MKSKAISIANSTAAVCPNGLIANWQMNGFDGSNQVVDVVSGNNLSVRNVADPDGSAGFIESTPVGDLHISEIAGGSTVVGYVTPTAPDLNNDVVSDGHFTEAPDPDHV